MALNQGIIGVQNGADGPTPATQRMGQQGDVLSSGLHAGYYEQTVRGKTFYGSNGATPSVTTVALATTYTGLALLNPISSTVNVVITKVGYSFLVVFPAVATVGLMAGWSPGGVVTFAAAASPGASSLVGAGPVPTGKCALSATFPIAPFLHTVFASGLTGAVNLLPQAGPTIVDMDGSCILPPGGYAAIYTSTVSGAASLAASFQWEEVPIIR